MPLTRRPDDVGAANRGALLAVVVVLVVLEGCYGHVRLPPPPPDSASQAQHDAYNERVRPTPAKEITTTAFVDELGRTARTSTQTEDVVVLHDGTVVRYPEDLIPVVGARSSVGQRAQSAADARRTAAAWGFGAGGAFFGGGLVMIFGPTLTGSTGADASGVFYTGVALSVAALVPGAIAVATGLEATELRREAFAAYVRRANHSLDGDADAER